MVRYWLTLAILFGTKNIHSKKIAATTDSEGYYWRDLIGDVPKDAVPGGKDGSGQTTYIGQTVHYGSGGSILTGPYIPKEKKMYYEYGSGQHTTTRRIKILCGLENFIWVPVKYDEKVERGQNMTYVLGGDDGNRDLAIGRIKFGDELVIGKVLILANTFKELFHHWNGSALSTSEYEALYYERRVKNVCSSRSTVIINMYQN